MDKVFHDTFANKDCAGEVRRKQECNVGCDLEALRWVWIK